MAEEPRYSFGAFTLDAANAQLMREHEIVPLPPKAFAVLQYLLERQGQLVTKTALLDAVWPETVVGDAVLKVSILDLRRALGDSAKTPQFIETVQRRGYRFIAPLSTFQPVVSPQLSVLRTNTDRVPAPSLTTAHRQLTTPFVGREAVLGQLRHLLAKALNGDRQIVFVTGEPGIGKTALIETFLSEVQSPKSGFPKEIDSSPQASSPKPSVPRMWVVAGQCVEHYGTGEAYLPVLEALSRLCRGAAGEQIVAALRQYAPMWLMQLPWLMSPTERQTLAQELAGASRERMLREMADALEVITRETPLVLVLEDLHWSDYSTLDLLGAVARRSGPARLMMIGSYRPVDVIVSGHPLQAMVQDLRRYQQCREVPLELLNGTAVHAYLTQRVPQGTVDAVAFARLVEVLHQRTSGNPLFLVNVVNELITTGDEHDKEDQPPFEKQLVNIANRVPDSIREMIERQVERLTPDEQQLLAGASVAGAEFSTRAVAAVTARQTEQIEERCEVLARRGQFLVPRGTEAGPDGSETVRYGFTHALYQQVLYDRVGRVQQCRMHRRLGEWEEALYGDHARERATELAMHFERAGNISKAVEYRQYAGENALRQYGYREALEHGQHGLALVLTLPETAERARQELQLHVQLGVLLIVTQGYAAPDVGRTYTRARELCQQLGEQPEIFQVLWGLRIFYSLRAELATARALAEQLLHLAQRAQDPALLVRGHLALEPTLMQLGEFSLAMEHFEAFLSIYDAEQHRSEVSGYVHHPASLALSFASWTLWFLGAPDQALRRTREALVLARELSDRHDLAHVLFYASMLHQFRREEQTARALAEEAITICSEHGLALYLAYATIARGWVLVEQGQQEEGIAQVRQGLAAYEATGARLMRPHFLAVLAEALSKVGQVEEGLSVLTNAVMLAQQSGNHYYDAEVYRLKGELTLQKEARDCRLEAGQEERPKAKGKSHRAKTPNPRPPTPSLRAEAEGYFLRALDIARQQSAKSWELRVAMSLARLWQRQEKIVEARALLANIYEWFTEGFETRDVQDARALLDSLS